MASAKPVYEFAERIDVRFSGRMVATHASLAVLWGFAALIAFNVMQGEGVSAEAMIFLFDRAIPAIILFHTLLMLHVDQMLVVMYQLFNEHQSGGIKYTVDFEDGTEA